MNSNNKIFTILREESNSVTNQNAEISSKESLQSQHELVSPDCKLVCALIRSADIEEGIL
jgi:hypothetical protein